MNEVSTSLNGLIDAITPAFAKMSEIFCISVDAIKENAMDYIIMYGRYYLITDIMDTFICSTISLIIILSLVTVAICLMMEFDLKLKNVIITNIIAYLILITIIILLTALPYIISPEIYSIKAVIELAQSGTI